MQASLLLSLLFTSTSLAIPFSSPAPSPFLYEKRADDDVDTSKWQITAVGDSYSAGVGAGTRFVMSRYQRHAAHTLTLHESLDLETWPQA